MSGQSAFGLGMRILLLAIAGLAIFRIGVALRGASVDHPDHAARFSLLAVGDTGKRHRAFAEAFEGQLAVARDLVAEDRAHPVDALLLLGDNFYMRGLRREELVARLRENLALPYCHFLDLSGPRSADLFAACPAQRSAARPRPLFAVLGNHDRLTRESPALQRDAIPAFLPNWSLATDVARVREVAPGLSLILLDSTQIERAGEREAKLRAVAAALVTSRGPGRILAAHAGMAVGDAGGPPVAGGARARFDAFVREAIERAGVPVQLFLAGHHHSLQAIAGEGAPALHVVSGAGSRSRAIRAAHPRALYRRAGLGFVRVDWVAGAAPGTLETDRLEVRFFESESLPLLDPGPARRSAGFSVSIDGVVQSLAAAPD